ncbi:MAG: BamA/TamA family outer membrane protein, partial [Alphaproteobacteria bacterium]|nr:BamA/TamA family outer membrane protein [Alphaproteobacteria bacterium]
GNYSRIKSMYSRYNIPIRRRAEQLEGGLFLSLSPALVYDTRDAGVVTRKGTIANIRFDENFGLNGFDKTHGKLSGSIKQYIPIGRKSSFSLMARAGGKIHGDDMPEVMAYRLGGPYSVRGFKMSGVGTGSAFVMGSAEFATPIPFLDRTKLSKSKLGTSFLNNIRLTAFVDAGKVFDGTISSKLYDRPMYGVAAGVGLKLYVPGMGPLSIDYGIPFTPVGSHGSKNGYFTFGVGDFLY